MPTHEVDILRLFLLDMGFTKVPKAFGLLTTFYFANRQYFVDSAIHFCINIFDHLLKNEPFPEVVYNCYESQENTSNCG